MDNKNEDVYKDIFKDDNADNTANPTAPTEPVVEEKENKETASVSEPTSPATTEPSPAPTQSKPNFPTKKEGEDEVAYNIRQQLEIAKSARDNSETEEEKSFYKEEMKRLRGNLEENAEAKAPTKKLDTDTPIIDEDEPDENVKARLEALGYKDAKSMSKEVADIVMQNLNKVKEEETAKAHGKVIDNFYKSRPEIYENKEARDFLEEFVVKNFRVTPNTSPETLGKYIQITAQTYFPKVDKMSKAQTAQDKVDLVNFSGSSNPISKDSSLGEKGESALKNMGWTDEQLKGFN